MQYSVPQFVDVEDKVIGPLSIRQFLYMLGGAGGAVVLWLVLPKILAIILDLPMVLLSVGLAFYKVNGVALQTYIGNLVGFVLRPNTRVWKREVELDKTVTKVIGEKEKPKPNKIRLSDVNLAQLTYILDHELAAQARPRPISNNVETSAIPRPQVIMKQDVEVTSTEAPIISQQEVPQPVSVQAEPEALPQPLSEEQPLSAQDLLAQSSTSAKNPNIVTSIKPFRTHE